jgi:5-methylcytosine-specific restriction protein A
MPTGAPKICAKSGCFALATKHHRCEAHQPKQTHGWSKEYDSKRGNRHQRGYTSKWDRASKNYLKANPLCTECYKNGKRKPATLVDHIEPHKGDQVLFWKISNWQGLCVPCHARKTGQGQ